MSTLPFEVFGDSGFEEDLDKFSTIHDILGNQINIPVAVVAELLIGLLLLSENFPEVGEVD